MRIASFNVENLFQRARALSAATWAEGKPLLEKHARINELINRSAYTDADKAEITALLLDHLQRRLALDRQPNDRREGTRANSEMVGGCWSSGTGRKYGATSRRIASRQRAQRSRP